MGRGGIPGGFATLRDKGSSGGCVMRCACLRCSDPGWNSAYGVGCCSAAVALLSLTLASHGQGFQGVVPDPIRPGFINVQVSGSPRGKP